MTHPTSSPTCPECGSRLPDDSPQKLCPACLLRQALASWTITGSETKPASPPLSPEEIADKFPQFEILECLGRGGMGVVYKARQKTLDRLVAIKVLAGERRDDPQFEERFSREARTLAKLSHPNIVTVHDFGESDGMFYLVMEFVDGVNLRDLLRDGRMAPEQALAIVPEICAALQFAHDHGVVHRDIKPENILMDRDGRVKIADFGIAALIGADAERTGTPPYMAPEQEAAGGTIDHRADIYALGVVFYEMLTGQRPEQDPSRPSRRVEIDVRLDEIVLRALEKEPARRYQTAGEFRTVVETITGENKARDLDEPATAKRNEAAGLPPLLNPQATPGMFARLWWLFLAILALGPLVGAVTGLRLMMPTVLHTVTAVINVKGGEREIAATAARITDAATLERVSAQLQLARAWNCKPAEVAPRLRRMIRVEPVANTTLIRLEVHHSNQTGAVPIADTITAALVDQPEGPAISLMEKSFAVPSKIRSALPVLLCTILGLVLSPLLALALMAFLHRRFPEPQPRRWTASVAGVLVIALLLTLGVGLKFLHEIRTAAFVQTPPGPVGTESPHSPEHVARSFMEAIRDGNIDAAMAWVDPEMKMDERLPKLLKGLSDELREEAYVGKLERLTRFTEWVPEHRNKDARFLAVRIAAPTGGPAAAVRRGLYLILSASPDGWRVAHVDDTGKGRTLSESLDQFLQLRVLALPVQPPLTMSAGLRLPIPDSERLTAEHAKRALKGVTWGTFLAAIAADGYNDQITIREAAAHDQTWRRFEIAFRWRESMMMFDLMVDPVWTQAEPVRLRNAATPDQILGTDAAVIMPQLAAEYIRRTDPILKEEIAARARHQDDVRTLEHYTSAFHIYRWSNAESSPPDLEPLVRLVESYYGNSNPKDLREVVGLIKNDITGAMERPIYHGNAKIRLEELSDNPNFIMFAAPSADAGGRRLVALGRGIYIRAIKEEDYQKQIAEQAKTATAGPAKPATPEQAARSFMEGIRDGNIDAAMAWMTGTTCADEFPPVEDDLEWLRESLQDLSDKLRQKPYAGELEKLTQFVQWLPELHVAKPRYIATRVAAPSDPDEPGMKNGIYLIMVHKPEGWRVLSFLVGIKKSFEDSVTEFMQRRALEFPVTPPLAMQENSPVTIDQVKTTLNGATWDRFLRVLSDRQGETVTAKEVAANGWNGQRYEVAFRLGSEKMLLDLLVDPAFQSMKPTRLRRAADPGEGVDDASEFLPVLAYHYTIRTAKDSAKQNADPGLGQLADIQTMEEYFTALDTYIGQHGSPPPDMGTLVSADYYPRFAPKDAASTGLLHNHQTGAMERPLYHGTKDLRLKDLDPSKFIILAAPSPDRSGKRLVVCLGRPVRLINETDYQQQIAEQAKTATAGPAKPATPEQAARSFMEAIRDGDIDAAMAWVVPEMKQREKFPLHLELSSKILRDEIYVGQLDRLTKFTEWSHENVDGTQMLVATRITPPGGKPSLPVNHGAVLILTSTPDGWKVAEFSDGGAKKTLSEHLEGFLRQRVLGLPVSPPLTMPKDYPLTADQAKELLQGVTWGDILNTITNDGRGGEISVRQLTAGGGSGPLYEVAFRDGDEKILLDLLVDWQTRRAEPSRLRPAAKPDQGYKTSSEILPPLIVRYAIQKKHPAVVNAGLATPRPGPRQVELLDFDRRGVGPTVLDLASGELLEVPRLKKEKEFLAHFDQLGKGDLGWDGAIITLRGARVSEWLDDGWTLRNPERELDGNGVYRIKVPTRLRITTAEGGHYIVDVLGKIEGIKDGVRIEYRRSDQPETGKNAPEAARPSEDKFPPEGAEIGRFVLGLPVQPPLAMPQDSPLTIDQVKEVLKGVTWDELLSALAEDGKGDNIAVCGRPSPGVSGSRYEITFRYGNNPFCMDLAVDWKFREAAPSRLRPAGMPGKVLAESSGFLPQMVIRYAMTSGHAAAAPAVEEAKAQARQFQDSKTLKQYATALMIYRDDTGSFPPDLATLLDGDFPGKKRWEGLQKAGLMHNHQTGKMERPIYHGSKDLRIEDHQGDKFILLAAPSADPQGKRLVAFLDGSVRTIDEADYQKQVAAQAKVAAAEPDTTSGIRVVERTATQWVINYTSEKNQSLSLWTGTRDSAGFLWIPEGAGTAKLKATQEGLILETGSERVGPIPLEAFSFAEGNAVIEQGGSVIIGKCSVGSVGIRITAYPAKTGKAGGAELTPDFKQATKGFHFKADRPRLLTRGTARYLVIPVAIQSEDHIIKTVDWSSRQADGNGQQSIDLSLVLEPSAKGNAKTSQRGKPRTTQSVIAGTAMNRKCQIRYANPDGTFVDLMTVDTGKIPPIPDDAIAPGKDVRITAKPDGTWLDDRKVSHGQLADALKQLHPDTSIIIESYQTMSHPEMKAILDICRDAWMVHIAVASQDDSDNE